MTIWEHLSEFAKRLKIILISLAITCSIGFLPASASGFTDPLHHFQPLVSLLMLRMKTDFLPSGAVLIASGMIDTVFVYMYITVIIGVVLSSPVIAYEVYAYIKPALYPHERKVILSYSLSLIGLFVGGLLMAYFLIIPITFRILIWFITSGGALPFIGIKDFYNWILTLMLVSGVFYTIPVFIVLLVEFGIVPVEALSGRRKYLGYAGLYIVLIIITPDPTPITATIIMLPFILIFEVAAFAAKRVGEGRRRRMSEYGQPPARPQLRLGGIGAAVCRFCGGTVNSSFCSACGKAQI